MTNNIRLPYKVHVINHVRITSKHPATEMDTCPCALMQQILLSSEASLFIPSQQVY